MNMDFRTTEEEVTVRLRRWLKDCTVLFYYEPVDAEYVCIVYFYNFNLKYTTTIAYYKELDTKNIVHILLSDISSFITKKFFKD